MSCCHSQDDVNAVTYADQSPNIIVSGSDDTSIKVGVVLCGCGLSLCVTVRGTSMNVGEVLCGRGLSLCVGGAVRRWR